MRDPEAYERAVQGALGLEKRVFWLAWICLIFGVNLGYIETATHTPEWLDILVIVVAGLVLMRVAVRGAIYWPFIRERRQQRRLDRTQSPPS